MEYLYLLAHSDHIKELNFPEDRKREDHFLIQKNPLKLISNEQKGTFIDKQGHPITAIHTTLYSDKDKRNKHPKPTGISLLFVGNEDLIKSYITILGYLDVLARILLNCREAIYLINTGGELLMSRITKEQLLFLVDAHNQVMEMISNDLYNINSIAKATHAYFLDGKKITGHKQWETNFFSSAQLFQKSNKLMKKSIKATTEITTTLKQIRKKMEKFKDRLLFFVTEMNTLSSEYEWLVPQSSMRALLKENDNEAKWKALKANDQTADLIIYQNQNPTMKKMLQSITENDNAIVSNNSERTDPVQDESNETHDTISVVSTTESNSEFSEISPIEKICKISHDINSHRYPIVGFVSISKEKLLSLDFCTNIKLWNNELSLLRTVYGENTSTLTDTAFAISEWEQDHSLIFLRYHGRKKIVIMDKESLQIKCSLLIGDSVKGKLIMAYALENRLIILTYPASSTISYLLNPSSELQLTILELSKQNEVYSFKIIQQIYALKFINLTSFFFIDKDKFSLGYEDGIIELYSNQELLLNFSIKELGKVITLIKLSENLFISGYEKGIKIWNILNGECVWTHVIKQRQRLTSLAKISDKYIASGFDDGTLAIWDITLTNSNLIEHTPIVCGQGNSAITSIHLHADLQLICGYESGSIENWPIEKFINDINSNNNQRAFPKPVTASPSLQTLHFKTNNSLLVAELIKWLETISEQGKWDIKSDQCKLHIQFNTNEANADTKTTLTQLQQHLSKLPQWQKVNQYQVDKNCLTIHLEKANEAKIYEQTLQSILTDFTIQEKSDCTLS